MINQKTDTFENVTVTVRARRGADVWDEFEVKRKLPAAERAANEYRVDKFVEFVTQTVSVEGLSFAWPTVGSSADAVNAAYAAWCDMTPNLMIKWANLIYDANQPPLPDENLIPGNEPSLP